MANTTLTNAQVTKLAQGATIEVDRRAYNKANPGDYTPTKDTYMQQRKKAELLAFIEAGAKLAKPKAKATKVKVTVKATVKATAKPKAKPRKGKLTLSQKANEVFALAAAAAKDGDRIRSGIKARRAFLLAQ